MPQIITPESQYDGPYAEAGGAEMTGATGAAALDDSPAEMGQTLLAERDPAPVSGGLITRVASDAIIGPIVDALPVTSASPEAPGMFGLPGPRSMPLAYELNSHISSEAPSVTMNWLDTTGLMAPLAFESVAVATADDSVPPVDAPLTFEAVALPADAPAPVEVSVLADDTAMAYELAQTSADETSDAQGEPQAAEPAQSEAQAMAEEPLALVAEPLAPPPVTVPVLTAAVVELMGSADTLAAPDQPDQPDQSDDVVFAPRPAAGVITRSLEDIWDELPNGADL
jgi:hypothetical protein